MKENLRKKAIEWWDGLIDYSCDDRDSKSSLTKAYHGSARATHSLTGREIQEIYYHEIHKK